jgi:eight-cysteine-cluster-containing protein
MRTRHMPLPCLLAAALLALAACQPAAQSGPSPSGAEPEHPTAEEPPTLEGDDDAAAGNGVVGDGEDRPAAEDGEPSGERVAMVAEDHPQYAHVEGMSYENACETDADCHTGGCSSEVCSADPEVVTTCIMPAEGWASAGGSCGCIEGQCTWYRGAGSDANPGAGAPAGETEIKPGRSPQALTGQGEACRDGSCPGPLSCVSFYGVAGPQGPKFNSCEIPCPRGTSDVCPEGQTCVTIADGPGQVCRPSSRE